MYKGYLNNRLIITEMCHKSYINLQKSMLNKIVIYLGMRKHYDTKGVRYSYKGSKVGTGCL